MSKSNFQPSEWDMDSRDVARVCGVSTVTASNWARSGKLPAVRLPGRNGAYRFRSRDVLALLTPVRVAR